MKDDNKLCRKHEICVILFDKFLFSNIRLRGGISQPHGNLSFATASYVIILCKSLLILVFI